MSSSRRNATIAAAALALLSQLCCSKNSPTEPETYSFGIGTASSYPLMLSNVNGDATIVRTRVILDGAVIADWSQSPPKSEVMLIGGKSGVSLGAHTLRIEVAGQTSSPNTYRLPDVVVRLSRVTGFNSGYERASATLPGRTQSLATGEAFEYQFSFN
jgi:hypothetical protein